MEKVLLRDWVEKKRCQEYVFLCFEYCFDVKNMKDCTHIIDISILFLFNAFAYIFSV